LSAPVLIAIEGVDGAGKTTQVQLLADGFQALGGEVYLSSFPRYSDRIFGDLIRRFLRGDLGELDTVHPWLVALLFAGDRAAEAPNLRQALYEDKVVICDRYFYSNVAYQAARIEGEDDIAEFIQWLRKLEFGHYALPAPACSIYLDVHQEERRERLLDRGSTDTGAVPNDLHERDMDLQARVEQVFRSQAEIQEDLIRIDCQQYGMLLNATDIHARIMRALGARGLATPPITSAS
jgi:dTMP kinase